MRPLKVSRFQANQAIEHFLLAASILAATLYLLTGCQTPQPHPAITAPARSSITAASTASSAAGQASERSTAHIQKFRNDAARIDYKATQALRILDHP